MLSFVFAESALELVPREICGHPAVASDASRRGMKAGEMLLDRSFHHTAMAKLLDSEKRGRPDLVHAAMLSVTATPFYLEGRVRLFVHTYPGTVIEVAEKTRIPKSYLRFRGLMEKALVEEPTGGLLRVRKARFPELVKTIEPGRVFGLTVRGRLEGIPEFAANVVAMKDPCVVVGGFPHGHFSAEVEKTMDELVRIDSRPMEAHVVAARVVYEIEKATKGFND
ncbi:MAG: ribosome biogenesis protein [Thaumarchaeota archaeon]|nr:ribosome biogenesis protein [Nitrososphaerota archaeon]